MIVFRAIEVLDQRIARCLHHGHPNTDSNGHRQHSGITSHPNDSKTTERHKSDPDDEQRLGAEAIHQKTGGDRTHAVSQEETESQETGSEKAQVILLYDFRNDHAEDVRNHSEREVREKDYPKQTGRAFRHSKTSERHRCTRRGDYGFLTALNSYCASMSSDSPGIILNGLETHVVFLPLRGTNPWAARIMPRRSQYTLAGFI